VGPNGDRATSRRSKRRAEKLLTPTEAGEMLRNARAQLGIELLEVHDRTGISWRNLEALESGEVQRFSDPAAAAVAMRRYAELVSLEPEPLVRSVTAPEFALAGAPAPGTNGASWAPGPASSDPSGHLRRYYGDHSHLGSFTQTAQVPAVGGGQSGQPTGAMHPGGSLNGYQAQRRKPKAPWALRFMIWFVLFLVLVGVAGISINHYKPQWLRDIHVLSSSTASTVPSGPGSQSQSTATTRPRTTKRAAPLVATSQIGIGTANVKVGAPDYTVVVTTSNLCWVDAWTPGSVNSLVNRTLTAGQTVSIPITGGQVSVKLGALAAGITVEIGGNTVSGWTLHPNAVPFVATFSST
jgi:cytoskeletal protein RodZ